MEGDITEIGVMTMSCCANRWIWVLLHVVPECGMDPFVVLGLHDIVLLMRWIGPPPIRMRRTVHPIRKLASNQTATNPSITVLCTAQTPP